MTVVLDTSVLVDVLRNDPAAVTYAIGLTELPVCSEVSRVEVMRGLRSSERRAAERLFQTLRWASVDEPVSRRAGELGRRWDRHRPVIGIADLLVAATVQLLAGELATANLRHYPMFPGLAAPY